jgi:hypothetical protein
LSMKSSDAVLHTIHMDGAASFNVPFPFPETITRNMNSPGLVKPALQRRTRLDER